MRGLSQPRLWPRILARSECAHAKLKGDVLRAVMASPPGSPWLPAVFVQTEDGGSELGAPPPGVHIGPVERLTGPELPRRAGILGIGETEETHEFLCWEWAEHLV